MILMLMSHNSKVIICPHDKKKKVCSNSFTFLVLNPVVGICLKIKCYSLHINASIWTIPRARLKLKGDRAFSVAAPKLWNLLPVSIRSAQTISSFKLLLKTYLLTQAFNLSECWVLCSLCLFVCVMLCLCLCIFMKMFFVCCCFLWLFGFLFLYSTLGNNGCIILCYKKKNNNSQNVIYSVVFESIWSASLSLAHKYCIIWSKIQ